MSASNNNHVDEAIRALQEENAVLKEKLRKAEDDSEAYRKAYQALAKDRITPAQLAEWDREEEDSGKTILDVLEEIQRED